MIPVAQITQWRETAPWPDDMQVEQDLILSRMIVEIFSDPFLQKELAFLRQKAKAAAFSGITDISQRPANCFQARCAACLPIPLP